MKKHIFILLFVFMLSAIPFACTNNYVLQPLSTSTNAVTPTATIPFSCTYGTNASCSGKIFWNDAYVFNYDNNGVYQYGATLTMAVNCGPETTDAVTMTGPGIVLPLNYNSNVVIGSTTYSVYASNTITGNLTPGDNYTMTAITSAGTASASVVLPINLYVNSSATTISCGYSMPYICVFEFQIVSGTLTYYTSTGFEVPLPGPLATLGIPCSCTYEQGAEDYNTTQNITNGLGAFDIVNGAYVSL